LIRENAQAVKDAGCGIGTQSIGMVKMGKL